MFPETGPADGFGHRPVEPGHALDAAVELATDLARLQQDCSRSDRLSAYEQWSLTCVNAVRNESRSGMQVVETGETQQRKYWVKYLGPYCRPISEENLS